MEYVPHFPRARRDGLAQSAVGAVVVDVLPARALARQEERSVREEAQGPGRFDPRRRRIAQDPRRGAARGGRGADVEPRLDAVLDVEIETIAAARPCRARHQDVGGIVGREIRPPRRAARHIHDPDPRAGSGLARFGEGLALHRLAGFKVVGDDEFGRRRAVDLEESQAPGIGRPPERLPYAVEDFFVVHPVGLAVPELGMAAGRQAPRGLRGDIH